MALKFVIVLALLSLATAGYISTPQIYHSAPATLHTVPVALAHKVGAKHENYDRYPQYKYSYGVEDKLSGDSKTHHEERNGDVVHGEYSLIDADGYKRTVKYTADAHNGFNAVVHREPVIKTASHYATPAVLKTVAPIAFKPFTTVAHYSTPVTHYTSPSVHKTVVPVSHYAAPAKSHYSLSTVVKNTVPASHYSRPVSHYSVPQHYTTYASPAVSYQH